MGKIFLLTLLGGLFAVPGGWGVTLVLDGERSRDRPLGMVLVLICLPITASFYSWAAYGDPLWVWGMSVHGW